MRIVLAGGGTTGHISPMLATAEALRVLDPSAELTCVGTPIGLETTVVPQAGFPLRLIDPIPLPRTLSPELVTLPLRIVKSVAQARSVLRDCRADAMVGFGGYVSLPVCLAARTLSVPVVIHEANAMAGVTNRIAARFAAVVCVTFPATGLPRQHVTGMPVRTAIATCDRAAERPAARQELGLDEQAKVLLVTGGSQGAQALNQATMAALPGLNAAGIAVVHVTGKKNFAELEQPDTAPGMYIRLPYAEHMDRLYAAADLMLARSGAATVTEAALVGLPAIFVPLPIGNGEQAKNAAGLVAAGAATLVNNADLTGERLLSEVTALFADDSRLPRMGQAARGAMPANAAGTIAQYALAVARKAAHNDPA